MHNKRVIGDYKVKVPGILINSKGGSTQMTRQNMNTNASASKNKNDPSTYTAYGDPVKSSSPTINNEFKKSTSPIAESTQNGTSRKD